MKRIDKELAALVAMSLSQLRERWLELEKRPAPAVPEGLLRRLIAQRLQEIRYGALPAAKVRELRCIAEGEQPAKAEPAAPALTPGARLIREWNGRIIAVEVRDKAFIWEERTYRSLSQIAREVTGAHWSGPRFFGLQRRG